MAFQSSQCDGSRRLFGWLKSNGLPGIATLGLTILAFLSKSGQHSVVHGNSAYAMTVTVAQFFRIWRQLLGDLFYAGGHGINTFQAFLIWALLIGTAVVVRSKHIWFAVWFGLIMRLPVIFIPYRHMFVMYVPMIGWSAF